MERLLEAGALDVQYLPAFMKKNRPAWQLQVLCCQEDIARLEQIIFSETTTIGIRRCFMERSVLPRKQASVRTPYGQVQVKLCQTPQGGTPLCGIRQRRAACQGAGRASGRSL